MDELTPNPNWRNDPATNAQKSALKQKGLTFPDDITKGEADTLFHELCSEGK